MKKKISRWLMIFFYLLAGINHFRDPEFYLPLIPDYLPNHALINFLSGTVEITFAFGLMFDKTRETSAYGIMLMLMAFIPSHVYFIEIGGCVENGLCVPEWVGWVRLLIIHPLLLIWAWTNKS